MIKTTLVGFLILMLSLSVISFPLSATAENDEKGDFEAPHVPNEIIIGFKAGTSPAGIENFYDKFFDEYQISELESFDSSTDDPGDRLVSISHPATKGILQKLANDPRVEFAEYNYIMTIDAIPNDSLFEDLWGLHNTGQFGGTIDADINATGAWDITTGSSDIIIGVIDTGVDYTHPDLVGNMWVNTAEAGGVTGVDDDGNGYVDDIHGWNAYANNGNPMDDHGHGTHVSGTIGGKGNNTIGVVGVNWNVSIAACKFLSASGSGSTSNAIECFNYFSKLSADGHKVLITNNSWGGGGYSTALYNSMNAFPGLHMAAAGNGGPDQIGDNNDLFPHYPSSYNLANLISVASTTRNDVLSGFSNYGTTSVDIAAPGSSILSSLPGGGYATWSGTSMATPHVAGAAGLIWSLDQTLSASQVKDLILSNGDSISSVKPTLTNARLNVFQSLPSTTPLPNNPPTADAGADQNMYEGDDVNLNGIASSDSDGYIASYAWTQVDNGAPIVDLTGANTVSPSFTAPNVGESGETLRFSLLVNDDDGATSIVDDNVDIYVADVNYTPIEIAGIFPGCVQKGLSVNVIISGSGFENGTSVTLSNGAGPTPTASVNSVSFDGTTINASITTTNGGPPRDRSWDVTVTNPDSSSSTLENGFLVTINPTCPIPTITIDDVTQDEGDSGSTDFTFTITRSGDTNGISSVVFATQSNSATPGEDYGETICLITFLVGATESQCPISVNGDTTPEPDETFFANLSFCEGCTISDSQGVGTIIDDDTLLTIPAPPVLSSTGHTHNTIDISWTTPSDGGSSITGYTYEWSDDNFDTVLGIGNSGLNSATISGLDPTTTYNIRVFATNGVGDSLNSNVESVTTSVAPTGLEITDVSHDVLSRSTQSYTFTITGSGFGDGVSDVTITGGSGPAPSIDEITSNSDIQITAEITLKSGGPKNPTTWTVTVLNSVSGFSDTYDILIGP